MNKLKFFAALCCAAMVFAACDKSDEPKNGSNNNDSNNDDPKNDTKEAVDLGLPSGLKWATYNVGATKPEEYGNYYAWGETATKETYSWDTYKHGDGETFSKYNATDGLTTLEAADDAAIANWGGSWRMPTDDEWKELRENCNWRWTDRYNDTTRVAGYIVASKSNDNSIFLPAAGFLDSRGINNNGSYGYYWSSSLETEDPKCAWYTIFSDGQSNSVRRSSVERFYGRSVRAVCK